MAWSNITSYTRANVLRVPDKPGLYALLNSSDGIVYIGGSDELQRRLLEHLPENEQDNPCIRNNAKRFQYRLLDNWEDEEQRLIDKYSPDCNRQ